MNMRTSQKIARTTKTPAKALTARQARNLADLKNACIVETLEGRTLMTGTVLAAPSILAASAGNPTTVLLNWHNNAGTATCYNVLRSTDGVHDTQLAKGNSGKATTYTDNTAVSGHAYKYEVQAFTGTTTSVVSNSAAATTPLVAASGLTASASGPTTVLLHWTDNDASATGYNIFRATDGVHFTLISKVTNAHANSYTDTTAASGRANQYQVQAFDAATTAAVSNTASAITPLVAPASLTVTLSKISVILNWTDKDTTATGYYVLRSTDNVHFTQIAQINSGTAKTYTDASTGYGTTYYYQVKAFNTVSTSAASNTANIKTPAAGVSIATRFGNELIVTAAGVADSILISQSGSNFSITEDGQTVVDAVTAAGLFIYTRGGADSITIDSSVVANITVETIDNAVTTITSAASQLNAWIDSTDVFSGGGLVHRVASFAGGVSKAIGAALANPKDSGATFTDNASLFGTGPIAGDINQGEVGDCYFLSSLAAFAGENPQVLTHSAVDMGDGTCVVQFMKGNTPTFVRVSEVFAKGPFNGFMFAHPGTDGDIWAPVFEKAFAYFRTGANTFASINSGWMGEVYSDFGVNSTNFFPNNYTETAFYNMLNNELSNGKAVTLGTYSSPPNLVGGHAYTLVSVYQDGNGVTHYVVRNPWGVAGDSVENAQGYATLTFAQMVANFADGCAAA